ncbi:MAG: YdcF family protein [Betaproteobacteria bacterium]|nr:YdcF family protein [Betaproteobacteria bacterium]
MNTWVITNAIAAWLLVPGCLLLLGIFGLARVSRHPRSGKALLAISLAALWLLATPWVARALRQNIEPAFADPLAAAPAQAIIVLGGGQYHHAPEYGASTVNEASLARLRYAAHLQRQTGKPVLVSGGAPEGSPHTEATAMKAVLENEFRVPVAWMESASNNTLENARLSRALLTAQGINRVYLITHAWHMPRARRVFVQAGFEVVPALTYYATHFRSTALDFMPNAAALGDSSRVLHELLGMLWYRLKSIVN